MSEKKKGKARPPKIYVDKKTGKYYVIVGKNKVFLKTGKMTKEQVLKKVLRTMAVRGRTKRKPVRKAKKSTKKSEAVTTVQGMPNDIMKGPSSTGEHPAINQMKNEIALAIQKSRGADSNLREIQEQYKRRSDKYESDTKQQEEMVKQARELQKKAEDARTKAENELISKIKSDKEILLKSEVAKIKKKHLKSIDVKYDQLKQIALRIYGVSPNFFKVKGRPLKADIQNEIKNSIKFKTDIANDIKKKRDEIEALTTKKLEKILKQTIKEKRIESKEEKVVSEDKEDPEVQEDNPDGNLSDQKHSREASRPPPVTPVISTRRPNHNLGPLPPTPLDIKKREEEKKKLEDDRRRSEELKKQEDLKKQEKLDNAKRLKEYYEYQDKYHQGVSYRDELKNRGKKKFDDQKEIIDKYLISDDQSELRKYLDHMGLSDVSEDPSDSSSHYITMRVMKNPLPHARYIPPPASVARDSVLRAPRGQSKPQDILETPLENKDKKVDANNELYERAVDKLDELLRSKGKEHLGDIAYDYGVESGGLNDDEILEKMKQQPKYISRVRKIMEIYNKETDDFDEKGLQTIQQGLGLRHIGGMYGPHSRYEFNRPIEEEVIRPKKALYGNGRGLYSDEIDKMMSKHPLYKGTIAADEIRSKILPTIKKHDHFGFIINTDSHNQQGCHWFAVYVDARPTGSKSIEVYDSFGRDPGEDLLKDIKLIADKLDSPEYLKLKINKIVNQKSSTNNCGYFSCQFLLDRFSGKRFRECSGYNDSLRGERDIKKIIDKYKTFGYV